MNRFPWKEATSEDMSRIRLWTPEVIRQNFAIVKRETLTQIEFGLRCKLCQGEFLLKYRPASFEKGAEHLKKLHARNLEQGLEAWQGAAKISA